jgi:hypothetical protein
VPPGAAKLTLLHNSLLVPEKYDRDIRHYEFKWLGWVSWGVVDLEASEALEWGNCSTPSVFVKTLSDGKIVNGILETDAGGSFEGGTNDH